MFLMRFTERAYVNYTEEDVRNSPNEAVRLTFSNSNFSPDEGHYLYNMYLDEYEYSEEVGFDGLMLNEHHNTPDLPRRDHEPRGRHPGPRHQEAENRTAGQPPADFRQPHPPGRGTGRNRHDLRRSPVLRDSVRGTGVESLATNTNPLHNRARFEEAHDLVIKTWTQPGPFRWEGDHYHFRVVNPFQTPLQKPHPPVWIPGTGSPETLIWCAERNYPYIFLETDPQGTQDMKCHLHRGRPRARLRARTSRTSATSSASTSRTPTKRPTTWARATWWATSALAASRLPRDYASPVGYGSRSDDPRFLRLREQIRSDPFRVGGLDSAHYDEILDSKRWIIGSPETVVSQLREVLSYMRPGILAVWTNDGSISHEDTMRCLELMGEEVLPALREIGEELELTDPFQKEGVMPGLTAV